jgi:pentatricopeptide repeat protein
MRSKLIKPTSITLGCMIEAVVNNGDAEGAYELLHQLQQDEQSRNAVNAVVYCSVLKGFARERKLDRVWDVYQEMSQARMEMSLITFNTIIDACARAGQMEQLPKVMEDMKKNHVDPNLVTYSTILKGHCQAGDVQLGFSTLKMMKQDTNLKPDEIMYNSLLEGCAKNGLLEEGLQLCEEMQKEGVSPSNFTLSILVKLLSRAHQVDKAFDMVRDLSQQFRFKPNAFVYTNLIQACISSRQHSRAMGVLETMVNARVHPDGRTYAVLVRDCIYNDRCEQASKLMRAALGLPGALDLPGLKACRDFDPKFLNEALVMLADRGYSETLAAPLFADIKSAKLNLFIHQDTQRRVAMSSAAAIAAAHSVPRSSQKGKGKGSR